MSQNSQQAAKGVRALHRIADASIDLATLSNAVSAVDGTIVLDGESIKAGGALSTSLAAAVDTSNNKGVRTVTGTTDTLVLADNGKTIVCTNAVSATITVPINASVAFPIGTRIELVGTLVGVGLSLSGLTTSIPSGKIASGVGAASTIYARKIDTNSWVISGDLATAP